MTWSATAAYGTHPYTFQFWVYDGAAVAPGPGLVAVFHVDLDAVRAGHV